ncbi:hypothetical protein N275_gp25 [Salmonella phage FSL SP-031]|uniref:Uncharacterized protein n=1 Tax=Salmonella phage FSL SP-031 TaxID=1173749 RepID=S4TNV5_9CAUD|nr:hypothetical protein N275_gp25 [Salmonella phage FSL SP-031]AGF88226.1 hypothetical protein SP031_00125 [Salmonella phage FSL SP-031]
MKITDKLAFEDAQIMARAAIEMTERWWKEAYWYGAMQALKAAYKGGGESDEKDTRRNFYLFG